jgi:malonyl-CoA/methylmalonyl-CoA synthetase
VRLGAIAVPVNLRYRKRELGHILADCTPRLLVTESALLPLVEEAVEAGEHAASLEGVLPVERLGDWLGDAASLRPPLVEGDDPAFIMYTSGTTGRSKGAMLSHNNILATVTALLAAWAWEQGDRLLLVLPLFHTHGLVVGLHCALAAGATTLLRPHYAAGATLGELAGGAATLFFAVPTIYVRLVEELRALPQQSFSAMRLFCSGSAPLTAETFIAFRDLTGHTILERYGMTETGMNLSNPYSGPRVAGSVGTPLPGVSARIVAVRAGSGENSALADVPPGTEGELLVRGANVFSAYWNAPDKTAASFSADEWGRQWFHTGDLARQDPATGYVTLLGRRHELIISGGFNVYPREIEEMLLTYPGIRDAAVVGMQHAEWGEVPAAWVVCDGALDEAALAAWCRTQLASFKVPRAFHVVAALPRNAMGKVEKNRLT